MQTRPVRPLERHASGRPDMQAFASPDPSLGLQVEWLWDGPITPAGIDEQLAAFASVGLREVVIEPWDGLVPGTEPGFSSGVPYLSPDFLGLIEHAFQVAEQLRLCLWIYDGNGAGDSTGAVALALEGHPELRASVRRPRIDGGFDRVELLDLDRLNPRAAQRLLDVQHRPILARLERFVPTTFRGFWKDEPHLADDGLPWSDGLPDAFMSRHGYPLTDEVLRSVVGGGRPDDRRHRIDYWTTIAERYVEAYLAVIQDWHARHGLTSLVQPLPDGIELERQMRAMGSLTVANSGADLPGCDLWPGSKDDQPLSGEEGGGLTHIQAVSAAHLTGRSRAQAEPYGLQGWGLELAAQKALTARLYARGINLVAPAVTHHRHTVSQATFCGDFGPLNGPTWGHVELLQTFACRLGELLTGGAHAASVALLHPQTSVWSLDPAREDDQALATAYAVVGGLLLADQHGFDVVAEEQLADAATTVADGAIRRHDHAFTTVVLPAVTTLRLSTVEVLERLVAQGGHVIVVAAPPAWSSDGDDTALTARLTRLHQAPTVHQVALPKGVSPVVADLDELRELRRVLDGVVGERTRAQRSPARPGIPTVDVHHVRCGNTDVVLLVDYPPGLHRDGAPMGDSGRLHVRIPRVGLPEVWDPDDGSVRRAAEWRHEEGATLVELDMAPGGAAVVTISDAWAAPAGAEASVRERVVLEGPFDVSFAPASLPLPVEQPGPIRTRIGDLARVVPGFSGTATYRTSLRGLGAPIRIDCGEVRDCLDVRVDGELIGRRAWPPYVVTTGSLTPGDHTLELEVTNTAANVMPGPDHDRRKPWGLFSLVTVEHLD